MAHLQLGLRLLLLLISCYGYIRMIGKHIRMEFSVGVFFASLCSTMFFAGILNILKETAWCFCFFGVVFAIQSFRRKDSLRPVLCPGLILFAVSAIVLMIALHGMVFTDYDDFSHWGTVAKVMYTQDRFPNYSDAVITFQSYPTGSAAVIYYFLTISGITSEWFQLYVQSVFTAGLLISLFAWAHGWIGSSVSALMATILMLCSTGPINLLVDTLLPVMGVSGLCVCYYYRENLSQKLLWVIPFVIALVAIKNSGILLAIALLLFALIYLEKKDLKKWAAVAAVPATTLLLWQKHVKLVFDDGLNARHSMSVESVTDTFLRKDIEDLAEITGVYVKRIFSLNNSALYLLILLAVLIFLAVVLKNSQRKQILILAAFGLGCYVIYGIGMLGMYLSTMPYGEAVNLAGFARYHRTILIFCSAFAWFAAAELVRENWKSAVCVWLLTVVLSFGALFPGLWYNNPKHCGFIRVDFEALVTENNIQHGKRYCVVLDPTTEQYSGYLKFVIRYLLDSPNMLITDIDSYEERENGWDGYDYLICFGNSGEMEMFLTEQFGSEENRVFTKQ